MKMHTLSAVDARAQTSGALPDASGQAADGRNRRQPAAHPGPAITRAYLEPLGLRVDALAQHVGMEPAVLGAMLAGERSLDVEAAIRIGRALQISPQTLMERQTRHDFAVLRDDAELESIKVLPRDERFPFPETGFLPGRLAGLPQTWGYGDVRAETLGFLADPDFDGHDLLLRLHELRTGSKLRIYAPDGNILWVGVVLETLEGQPLLPYARPAEWIAWFAQRYRADFIPAQ